MQPKIKTAHTKCPGCSTEFVTGIDVSDVVASVMKDAPPKEVIKEVVKPYDYQPNAYCTNGNCAENHHKDSYKQKVTKKCTTCGQYAPKKAAKCAWCRSVGIEDPEDRFEELDEDELSLIPDPDMTMEAHTH